MKIDWGSLAIVALTTVAVTIAVVGVVTAGVAALAVVRRTATVGRDPWKTTAGWACLAVAGLVVLFGLYLITPLGH